MQRQHPGYCSQAALFTLAALLACGNLAYGQAGGGKGGKDDGKSPPAKTDKTDKADAPDAASGQQRLTVQTLIGDAVGDAGSPTYQDVTDAITRITNRDLVGAKELLDAAVKKNPNLPPASVLMAKILFMANQVPAARVELERAVRDFPTDPEPYLIFAQIALREGQFTDADLLLQHAKKLSDAYKANAKRKRNFDIGVVAGLAMVAEAREQWDPAIANLRAWLVLDPNSVPGHQRLGVDLFRKDKGAGKSAQEAYKEFQAAMAIDEKANAEISLAELYQTLNDPQNSKKWVDFAVKKYPADLVVHLKGAQLAAQGNRLDEAVKFAEAAVKIDSNSVDAKTLRAGIARLVGDMKTSESLYEQLHSASPSNLPAANALAQVLVDQDSAEKQRRGLELAKMNLQAATEGNRTNRELLATFGWALFRNGQLADAEKALQQIVANGQLSQDYAYYIAKAWLEPRGEYAAAIRLLEDALKSPQPFVYRLQASELLAELKKKPPQTERTTTDPVLPPVTPEATPGSTAPIK